MRHFADELRADGWRVDYRRLDAADPCSSISQALDEAARRCGAAHAILTECGEWRLETLLREWAAASPLECTVLADSRFLCSRAEFAAWATGRPGLRMEHFYRLMRQKTGLLMVDGKPAGGRWNFDTENRKKAPKGTVYPEPPRFAPDSTTRDVLALVEARFSNSFGALHPFRWPVTRGDALLALDTFVRERLPRFGDYQDAMAAGEDSMFHSLLSASLNLGLLSPLEVCRAAEASWVRGDAPLNAVEGFIRQIVGWREFVRGVYFWRGPAYAGENALQAFRLLPDFFWTGRTRMRCLSAAVDQTRRTAHAHHIQRLMVIGNFSLLAGLLPQAVAEWFLGVYADAYEWVELPNVVGMALHADGGLLGSKPYAASGAYINRMSDYCRGCAYDVGLPSGEAACPFNYLYWNFIDAHESRFAGNPRMAQIYANWRNQSPERRRAILSSAERFLSDLDGCAGSEALF
jgi:deoxyribodipyrimidine photolyase-related protein